MRYAENTSVSVEKSKGEIESTVEIALNHGTSTIIDAEDLHIIAGKTWRAVKRDNKWYACADGSKHGSCIYMHRLITGAKAHQKTDHKDHDGLNNCRNNLRICSNAENMRNRSGPNCNGTTGFIGVYYDPRSCNPYVAKIKTDGKSQYVGRFATAEMAARARDAVANKNHGDFAYLNFPNL